MFKPALSQAALFIFFAAPAGAGIVATDACSQNDLSGGEMPGFAKAVDLFDFDVPGRQLFIEVGDLFLEGGADGGREAGKRPYRPARTILFPDNSALPSEIHFWFYSSDRYKPVSGNITAGTVRQEAEMIQDHVRAYPRR